MNIHSKRMTLLERLESRALVRRQAHAFACVTFCLTHPLAQRLRRAPNLRRDRDDRRPLRFVLMRRQVTLTSEG